MYVTQMYGFQHLQFHAAPQSGAHQPRHDVPAVGVGCTARVDRLDLCEIEADRGRDVLAAFDYRRTDVNLQRVLFADGFQRLGDVETMLDEHVVGRSDLPAVDPDVGITVDAVEIELDMVAVGMFGRGERAAVTPLVTLPRAQVVDVAADLELFDQPRGQQVQLHVSRNGGVDGFHLDLPGIGRRYDRGVSLRPVVESPFAVERTFLAGRQTSCGEKQRKGGGQFGKCRVHIGLSFSWLVFSLLD